MFTIKNVFKQYGEEFALQDVTLQIGKGMNFIVGASGSGKTSLLKMISGMDQDFSGEVFYCDKNIKELSNTEKSYFYHSVFGFVWQDFNLLEDRSVYENIAIAQYLDKEQNHKSIRKVLKELNLHPLAEKKVKYLSGGEKQRVAIARELMKHPQVIFADEPTSALDQETAQATMELLRSLARNHTVIVVTHDTSFITDKDSVYELDKGELVSSQTANHMKTANINMQEDHFLSVRNAMSLAKVNIKSNIGRFMISAFTLLISSVLLLTTCSGSIHSSSQESFDTLYEKYGDALTDISIIQSFLDGASSDGSKDKKPNGEVSQDINGLFELYAEDERVSFITYLQAFDDIRIRVENTTYNIESSGNNPTINKLLAGRMPNLNGFEVVVPKDFVKTLGISPEDAIGKNIDFNASMYNWSSGEPVSHKTSSSLVIVGVMDTTAFYEYDGKVTGIEIKDSFLFSKDALVQMMDQAGNRSDKMNFMIRTKTPADMIAIKDELNKKGIVPLGQFELVEDMVRLQSQTTAQSGYSTIIVGLLSILVLSTMFLIAGFMRRKEIAIYQISGFSNVHICRIAIAETVWLCGISLVLWLLCSPLLNLLTQNLFALSILKWEMLGIGALLLCFLAVLSGLITIVTFSNVKCSQVLKSGDR